ncbi:MAG: glycosyltransferase [Actinobacteria bacterium]|nr:glycosyltransferase [Actinomycetota bacterium]
MTLPTVQVPPRKLAAYAPDAGEDAVERLRAAAEPLRGMRLLQVNSTGYGGGVAELLTTHVPLLNDLGIDTTWAVIEGSDDFFTVTKTVHNGLQGMDVAWTPEMESVYLERVRANAAAFDGSWDLVLIHDPQPAALLAELGDRSAGRWTWRCHIDLSAPNERVWSFFEPMVNRYDAAIFTLEAFAQPGVTQPRLAFIPPSIDPTTEKNHPLSGREVLAVLARYGVDPSRPLAVQISRFDPWKDPIGVIDAYRLARRTVPDLQLVMAGSMAADDPEGQEYLRRTASYAGEDPGLRLLTDADGVGHLEVNAFQRAADVVIQKSTREGFGLVVSEGMWKGKPVVGGAVGGIRLQVVDGETGYLVDSAEACADRLSALLLDPGLRARMGDAGRERVRDRFLSLRELEDHLRLFASLVS